VAFTPIGRRNALLRDYEILYVIRPELDDDGVNEAVKTVETLIKNLGGDPARSDVWGRRRLAYEVAHLREGYYVLTDFTLPAERVTELEATLKISDSVFRHLVTRKPEKAKRQGERSAARAVGERAPREQPQPAAAAATAEAPAAAVAPEPEEEAEG
jgi:small subunit ribosomal protein S6